MSHLFEDPAVIEAVVARQLPMGQTAHFLMVDRLEKAARDDLAAAVAALDREALIEKAASALAISAGYNPNSHDPGRWPEYAALYRRFATDALVAIGLIPDSPEGTSPTDDGSLSTLHRGPGE